MPHPTTRVLAALELLQSHGQIGGAELAARLEVDRRTLRRYITMLEDMGVPITTEQGRYGGYRLVPGYKLPPMMFTDDMPRRFSWGSSRQGAGTRRCRAGHRERAGQARSRAAQRAAQGDSLPALRESVALQTGDPRATADAKLLRVLSEAAQSRRVALDALSRGRRRAHLTRVRRVRSRVQGGRWYVVGYCHLRAGLRTLRLDRVAHAELALPTFVRPKDFDAAEYLTRALATLPRAARGGLHPCRHGRCAARDVPHARSRGRGRRGCAWGRRTTSTGMRAS